MLYTFILVAISLMPYIIRMSGELYLLGAVLLGLRFLYWATVLVRDTNPKAPMATFRFSIIYLGLLFLVLLVDHYTLSPIASGAL